MELIKKNIHMQHHLNLASTQISLEEDQNISDLRPDAEQIICKKACVKVGETKIQEDSVIVKGTLLYKILYLTDEKEKRLYNMEGELPFEEKVYIAHKPVKEYLRIMAKAEDMMVRLINSRKMNIRCIIALEILQDELFDEEIIVDVEEKDTCEIQKKIMDITTIVLDTKDLYRIKEEIQLPEGMPNIYNLLWENIRIGGVNFVPMDGRIGIQGEWTAFFLYEGEEEGTEPRWFEMTRPFSGILEVPDCKENMLLCMDYEMETPQIEVRGDYDGEERLIGMDIELKMFLKLYQNIQLPVVTDAYGLQEAMDPIMRESECEHIIKKEYGKIKLGEVWENKDNVEMNLQILHIDGEIVDIRTMPGEEEAVLSGVVHMEILCKAQDENNPYRCISVDIPYQQNVAVPGAGEDSSCYGRISVEQMTVNVQNGRMDIRVILGYQLHVSRGIKEPVLAGMGKIMEKEDINELPVMTVYFVNDKETLWDIGKKYRVSLNEIKQINQLNGEEVTPGQRVMVVKGIL